MNDLQLRIEVQNYVTDFVAMFMQQNAVPAHIMEDALNKVLVMVKEHSMAELINAINEEKAKADVSAEEGAKSETVPTVEGIIE